MKDTLEDAAAGDKVALKTLTEIVGDKSRHALLYEHADLAAPALIPLCSVRSKKVKEAALTVLLEIAPRIDAEAVAEPLLELLEDDKETRQKLGLAIVAKLSRPPLTLLEPVADLSSMPGAGKALLRFPADQVKRELRSLIKSRDMNERIVGLETVQSYGSSAEAFAPLIAQVLAGDTQAPSAKAAVHTLARLLPDDELAKALEPALDHWSDDVQRAARLYLDEVSDAPVRTSAWEGHPFSKALRIQLQRLGFVPKPGGFDIPQKRPLPLERTFDRGELEPSDRDAQLSPGVWAWLNALEAPPYNLYTVWGSYEDAQTFHFSDEEPLYAVKLGNRRALMHVIGDGSIGYFATIDLLDPSDDPAVYYMERWGGWGDGAFQVNWTMSGYLRQLGNR